MSSLPMQGTGIEKLYKTKQVSADPVKNVFSYKPHTWN